MTATAAPGRPLSRLTQVALFGTVVAALLLAVPAVGVVVAGVVAVVAFRRHATGLLAATTAALVTHLAVVIAAMPV